MSNGKAKAYTNIALIKYWGKQDEDLIIPSNSSLSLTLDAFYTITNVSFSKNNQKDRFYLNKQLQNNQQSKKVYQFLDLVRKKAQTDLFAEVTSYNHVPTAAGLASSASGMAALAGACNEALRLNLSNEELSALARRGSGSACRSIFGGFVEWEKGNSDSSSLAHQIESNHWEDQLAMIFILVNDRPKTISSRLGMQQTVKTSSYFPIWVKEAEKDLIIAKNAIANQDFEALGKVSEANALKMHATTLACEPPFSYWSPDSLRAMDEVRTLRQQGFSCYFTMDAGPNVKVLCQKNDAPAILQELQKEFLPSQLIIANAGPGIEFLERNVSR